MDRHDLARTLDSINIVIALRLDARDTRTAARLFARTGHPVKALRLFDIARGDERQANDIVRSLA